MSHAFPDTAEFSTGSIRCCLPRRLATSCSRSSSARWEAVAYDRRCKPPVLQMAAPKRGKPPVHFADMDVDGARRRRDGSGAAGFQGASNSTTHYFTHLTVDPDEMSDLPAVGARGADAGAVPAADDAGAHARGRQGRDGQDAVEPARRRQGRVRADEVPRARHAVRHEPGRMRHGVPVLRDGPDGSDAQSVHRGDPRAGAPRGPRGPRWGVLGEPVRLSNVVFMGMGEPLANYKAVIRAVRALVAPRRTGLACRPATSRCRRWVWCPGSTGSRRRASRSRSRCRCTRPTTSCAANWCRSTPAGASTRRSTPLERYFDATGRRVSIEYALIRDINDQAHRADLLGRKLDRARHRLGARQPHSAEPDPREQVDGIGPRRWSRLSSTRSQVTASPSPSAILVAATSTVHVANWPSRRSHEGPVSARRIHADWVPPRPGGRVLRPGAAGVRAADARRRRPRRALDVRRAAFDLKHGGYKTAAVDTALDRLETAFAKRAREQFVRAHGQEAWMKQLAQRAQVLYPRLRRPKGERFRPPGRSRARLRRPRGRRADRR